MPSNIFANTGTNVSVLFIDKTNNHDNSKVILVDASKLGEKRKEGKNQKTILRQYEIDSITDTFLNGVEVKDFSVVVSYKDIKNKFYSWAPGQYFNVELENVVITEEQYRQKMSELADSINSCFKTNAELEAIIKEKMEELANDFNENL